MRVYKTYFKVLKKQLISIIMYGIMFFAVTAIVTSVIFRESSQVFQANKVSIHVKNMDESSLFVSGMLTYLEQYAEYEKVKDNEDARRDALFNEQVSYILTIPENFTENLLEGRSIQLIKDSIPYATDTVSFDTALNSYLNLAKLYIKHQPGASITELKEYINRNLEFDTQVNFDVNHSSNTVNRNEYNKNYFNYMCYFMIMCFIIGVSNVMVSFYGIDIQRRHLSSPLTGRSYNVQLIIGNLVFVMGYLFVFIIAGYFLNPYRSFSMNLVLSWINVIVFGLTVLSISYLIGISTRSSKVVQAISTLLSLGLSFISGVFVPQEFMGTPVLRVASFTPSYWYVKTNNTIATLDKINFSSMEDIFTSMGIQLGFAAAFISIALVISKRNRQQVN